MCASSLEPPQAPDRVTLRLGTLDDTTWLRPAAAIWMKSAQPWFLPAPGMLTFDLQPEKASPPSPRAIMSSWINPEGWKPPAECDWLPRPMEHGNQSQAGAVDGAMFPGSRSGDQAMADPSLAPGRTAIDWAARFGSKCEPGQHFLLRRISPEDQQVQSMPDASPTKWHLAHTSWFFETFILKNNPDLHRVFDETFEYLFNSYYEAVGPRHPRGERGLITRPDVAEILAYRAHVDAAMTALIAGGDERLWRPLDRARP